VQISAFFLVSASFLVALTPEVTTFAAAIACLRRIWAVLRDVAGPVALVARDLGRAIIHLFGAVACPMTQLVAFITRWIVRLGAVFRNVADPVAAITPLRLLGARACKVPNLITFVTLLAVITASHIATTTTTTATAAAASSSTAAAITTTTFTHSGITVAGIVTRTITLIARRR